jgi:hypothetical protein
MREGRKQVIVAAYLFEDLARRDFDALVSLVAKKSLTLEGLLLVQKHLDGDLHLVESGKRIYQGEEALAGGDCLAVGLLAPALLPVASSGAIHQDVVARFEAYRTNEVASTMDAALPAGAGGIVAVCDPDDANAVELALTSAIKRTAVQIASLTAQRLIHQMTRPSDEPTTSD